MPSPLKIVGLVVAAVALWFYFDKRNAKGVHEQNLFKAAAFEREFDGRIQTGATRTTVEEYLERTGLKWYSSLSEFGNVKTISIEVMKGKSPEWYCGNESVGVIAHFCDDKLKETEVAAWSLDCL